MRRYLCNFPDELHADKSNNFDQCNLNLLKRCLFLPNSIVHEVNFQKHSEGKSNTSQMIYYPMMRVRVLLRGGKMEQLQELLPCKTYYISSIMCLCLPQFNFIFQIDEASRKHFLQRLPALISQRQKIKTLQDRSARDYQMALLPRKADIIFYNGVIYTMEEDNPIAEAVAVVKDRIAFVGLDEETLKWQGPNTKLVDLKRRTLLPGFVEPHIHMAFSSMKHYVQLSPFLHENMDKVYQKIVEVVGQTPQGSWAQFQLFDPMITVGTIDVSRKGLDLISSTIPIFILEANGHVAHVNSAAFVAAGIDKDTPDPPHGRFIRNYEGELTGEVQETATGLFVKKMPATKGEDYLNNFAKFIAHASSKGCTTLHDCGIGLVGPEIDLYVLHETFKDPAPVRYCGYLVATQWDKWQELKIKPQFKDTELRINGIKCWVDGSTQAGSAFLQQPYFKAEWGVGFANYAQQTLNDTVKQSQKRGFQVGIHANGDAGIEMALKAFELANKQKKMPELRHRIEHSTICHKYQLNKMKQLGISPSFLIGHVFFYGAAFRDRILGESRARLVDPVRSALEAGLIPSIHCDYNCQPLDPLRCIHNAVTRAMKENGEVLNESECVPPYEAIKMMTIYAAWQCHMEDIVGSIRKGKFADFVVLEEDPMKVPEKHIVDIKIWQTWKGGEKWYQG